MTHPGRDRRAVHHPPVAPGSALSDLPGQPRVVVIGGGIAGLAAAAQLSDAGVAVTVLEREAQLGGRVRSWPVSLPDGSSAQMSRGFHAFFRQYYQLRDLLRRVDPDLGMLRPLPDYPLVRHGGGSDSFAGIPRTPPLNLIAFVARSPSFTLAGLRGVDVEAALSLLDVDLPAGYHALDGVSAAAFLDRLRFPESARHLALEVFARSFFADPEDFSAAELLAMFHMYFVGSAEGLLFDVPRDDYDSTLWEPLRAQLAASGVQFRLGTLARSVEVSAPDHVVVVTEAAAGGEATRLEADAVVIALDPPALRSLVAQSPSLGSPLWRDTVAAVRSAPRFIVWRLWLDGPLDPSRPPFLGTSGYGRVDNLSALHLFEDHAATWARTTGGSVVEIHAYAVDAEVSEAELRADLGQALHEVWPETAGLGVIHEEWLDRADCVLVPPESWAARPGVQTPDPRVVLAGDCIRVDLPVALMERAATTGVLAASTLLQRWGRPGVGVWTVPLRSRLGPWPGYARRGIRTARRGIRTARRIFARQETMNR